ncbi:MAG: hypothetical protein GY940_40500 [bacterium]|nr:hypothetical protein [bacterium]
MLLTNKSIEQYLESTRITLVSLGEDTLIKEKVLVYGFDDQRLLEGITLRNEADTLYHSLLTSRGKQARLSFDVDKMFNKAGSRFSAHVKILKTEFFDTPALNKELGLEGRRKRTIPAFIVQATNFYTNSMTKQHILDSISPFGMTAERIQEELAFVNDVKKLHLEHAQSQGECQRLLEERDLKLARLRRYMYQLKTVLFLMFDDNNAQTLERINIFVRNRRKPRTRKATEETPTETPEEPEPEAPAPEPETAEPTNTGTEPATQD